MLTGIGGPGAPHHFEISRREDLRAWAHRISVAYGGDKKLYPITCLFSQRILAFQAVLQNKQLMTIGRFKNPSRGGMTSSYSSLATFATSPMV